MRDYGLTRIMLRLVDFLPPPPPAFEREPIDLRRQPTRPGVTHSEIQLRLPVELATKVLANAAEERLPVAVWAGLVIESERALDQAQREGQQAEALRDELDRLARVQQPPVPGAASRLAEFGRSLRKDQRRPELAPDLQNSARLVARVPYPALTAWRRAAIESGQSVDEWATAKLTQLPRVRYLWEASAAERGETLAEWVLVQAARR